MTDKQRNFIQRIVDEDNLSDLIETTQEKFLSQYNKIYIITGDHDYLQLLYNDVSFLLLRTTDLEIFSSNG